MHQRSSQFLDTSFINQEAKCWLVCKCNSKHSIPWRGWAIMRRDNVGQFWMSRGRGSQCAADSCGSAMAWCKARYIFKAFPASPLSARGMIHTFYISKRPRINAVTSAGEEELDPIPRTPCSGPVLKCSVITAISVIRISAHCMAPHDAEEVTVLRICANTPITDWTCFVLEILSLCWNGAEEKQHDGGRIQLNIGRHSLDYEGWWVYLKWVCCWQEQSATPESGPYGRNPEPCALLQYTLCCWMSIHRQSTYCSKACKKQV